MADTGEAENRVAAQFAKRHPSAEFQTSTEDLQDFWRAASLQSILEAGSLICGGVGGSSRAKANGQKQTSLLLCPFI